MLPIDLREKGSTLLCSFKIRQQRRSPFFRASCNYLYIQSNNYYRLIIKVVLIIWIIGLTFPFYCELCVYVDMCIQMGNNQIVANKMIQNSQHYNQDYQYFSNPQIIQEIRQNLTPFANYDDKQHQDVINSLSEKVRQFLFKSGMVGQDQAVGMCDGIQEIMQGVLDELKAKSNNLASVASLSIKMIDFITDQSANYYQAIEDYQIQVDRLQNIVHDLNNKNNIIQTDVQIFKEQLEAARNELDQISQLRQENVQHLEPKEEDLLHSLRQSRIQCLEVELQKMRAQLSYYKASGLSRGSLKCEDVGFKNSVQTKSLFYLNQNDNSKSKNYLQGRSEIEEGTLAKYSLKNKQLQQENERLRIQINNYRNRCSQQNLGIQQKIMGRSKSLARVKTSKNMNTSSSSFFDFTEFFTLLKSKHHQKLQNICQEREAELQQLQTERKSQEQQVIVEQENVRHLRSEWSRCSLGEYNHPQLYEPPQLIYLTHESQDIPNDNTFKEFLFESSPTKISVSRQTEASSCDPASFESVGINTIQSQMVVQEKKESWVKRMLKGIVCNSYVDRIKDLVVTNRIKQKISVVNRGAMQLSK